MRGPGHALPVAGLAALALLTGCAERPAVERGNDGAAAPHAAPVEPTARSAAAARRERAGAFVLASPGRMPACRPAPVRAGPPIDRTRWLGGVTTTEYYPVPERWFSGRRVRVPGLASRHRVDWLYSAKGVAMQGEGIALDGRRYGVAELGSGSWVNRGGEATRPARCAGRWTRGWPVWFEEGWRNRRGAVTFPLDGGGWVRGVGRRARGSGLTFARRPRPTARPNRTVAVDPRLIPRGSRVYIPAYRRVNGGWFVAEDVGGAVIGRHIDVYRRPPRRPGDGGRVMRGQRVKVVPPGVAGAG